jgi:L-fuconolactonase
LDAAIPVQVRQTEEENRFLLDIADASAGRIAAVVGWAPLADAARVDAVLERYGAHPRFKGVRHILQDEPANALMDDTAFNAGVERLAHYNLVYDLLIYERHLEQAIRFVDRHRRVRFVLDHAAKPRIKDGIREPWARLLRELARRPNVYCKISGMATEADWQTWKDPQITPYLETALEAFGASRLMFGSDWPVMLVASDYSRWVSVVEHYTARLSAEERRRIWGETAREAYGIG